MILNRAWLSQGHIYMVLILLSLRMINGLRPLLNTYDLRSRCWCLDQWVALELNVTPWYLLMHTDLGGLLERIHCLDNLRLLLMNLYWRHDILSWWYIYQSFSFHDRILRIFHLNGSVSRVGDRMSLYRLWKNLSDSRNWLYPDLFLLNHYRDSTLRILARPLIQTLRRMILLGNLGLIGLGFTASL